jgi:hypothetical protein
MGQGQMDVVNPFLNTVCLEMAIQVDAWFAESVTLHFDISPPHVLS